MGKSIFYRLFRIGGLPKRLRRVLEKEGLVYLEEGVSGWITMKDFRGPGRYSAYRKNYFVGAIVITERRFVVFKLQEAVVEVPLHVDWLSKLQFSAKRDSLEIIFDPQDFNAEHSGAITLSLNVESPKVILDRLRPR